jgi:hypothetical protein
MVQTVGQLLNSAQDSAAASERCAAAFWRLALQDPDATHASLLQCMDYLVTLGQVCSTSLIFIMWNPQAEQAPAPYMCTF